MITFNEGVSSEPAFKQPLPTQFNSHGSELKQEPIAIVGLACRLPGNSNSPTAFWDFLVKEGIAHNEPPSSRFKLQGHYDGSTKPGTMRSPGGMFLENIDPKDIDARFFALSKSEAISMDPQQRQLLEVVYEGLENAGISLKTLKGQSYGCFVGSYASDYSDMQARDPEDRTPSWTVGSGRAMLSNRISHFLDIKGPSMTIDTACSGGLISVDLACRYLQTRDADGAIVAGCNLYMSPEHNMDQSAVRVSASPSGRCHTFDIKADGYIKAEAVNMVVLKRLDDALRDGDPIRAIIRGSSTNSDGWTPGIASPSCEAQAIAIRRSYARAGLSDLQNTSYLECHGTGTQAGDPIEVTAVSTVFSSSRAADNPLLIGSVKSNIGHSEPGAGISGLLKTILALEHGIIPGNPTFETPNPKIAFHALKVCASRHTMPWPKVPFRRASVNSFGYGGSNAHVILDEPSGFIKEYQTNHVSSYTMDVDDLFADEKIERPHVLLFSANDEVSLNSNIKAIVKHLVNPNVDLKLQDLAYTLSERRTHHFHRAYTVATNTNLEERSLRFGKVRRDTPRIGFVFTGQGAQWSQMGKGFIESFPLARPLLVHLDEVLQSLPNPPKWSLLDELLEPRTREHLRSPEFSQPLVTALQLVILAVLNDWNLLPDGVVGHSSGEIAAAAAAGYITSEEAIKIAYFRGRAAIDLQMETEANLGMLAIGLGCGEVQTYLTDVYGHVQIACINSPHSTTLSGRIIQLETIRAKLQADGHFARLLEVNLAYHSDFMTGIASQYQKLLGEHFTGRAMDCDCDSNYWKNNMVSPVLFHPALKEMLKYESLDFLIEIGPSGALAGPIAQIKKELGEQASALEYCTTSVRGPDAVNAIFDVAGRIFLSGGSINIQEVNAYNTTSKRPAVIIDLPNYAWNHSIKYWYESDASKDWRFKEFANHDLLGNKVIGTSWLAPSWKKILRVSDIPWLKDHQIGEDIVFPAAGYIAMAVEAFYQMSRSVSRIDNSSEVFNISYKLRNINFLRAMVLEREVDNKIFLNLIPCKGPKDLWYEFRITSFRGDTWAEHCNGQIRLLQTEGEVASENLLQAFKHGSPARSWYKALGDVGYSFGPCFQKQVEVESLAGKRYCRVRFLLSNPNSLYTQSTYSMHPVCIDACLQSGVPSLWQGCKSAIDTALVPAVIDDLVLRSRSTQPEVGIAISTSEYEGIGSVTEAKNYKSHATIYDEESGSLLFQMSGLHYNRLDTHKDRHGTHQYTRLSWKPDINFLTEEQLHNLPLYQQKTDLEEHSSSALLKLNQVIDLVAHKKPNLTVMEVNMASSSHSFWFERSGSDVACRAACLGYLFRSNRSSTVLEAQEKYQHNPVTEFSFGDITKAREEFNLSGEHLDLLIIRLPRVTEMHLDTALENARGLLKQGGHLLIVHCNLPLECTTLFEQDSIQSSEFSVEAPVERQKGTGVSRSSAFEKSLEILSPLETSNVFTAAYLYTTTTVDKTSPASQLAVSLVNFTDQIQGSDLLCDSLTKLGCCISKYHYTNSSILPRSQVLVLDDKFSPVLPNIRADQWKALQNLIVSGHQILWVTIGSQYKVSNPQSALIHGLARSARAEDPTLALKTLDVESAFDLESSKSIYKILLSLEDRSSDGGIENEYSERDGIIHTSRILPDEFTNQAERESAFGTPPELRAFHGNPFCVRMQCERPGAMDSLYFSEVSTSEIPLGDGFVEVAIYAAGLNYKDVTITMGIVPGDQYLLGFESAGIIKRIGSSAVSYKVGDRVVVDSVGCLANRVQVHVDRIHTLPTSMSFEEGATLCIVYLTATHALLDLADLQQGQTVLIHSAAGGVGIAAIQVCKYIGAKVYATVGSEEKRRFLMDTFDIPPERIYSSRSSDFKAKLMAATKNIGVNVILNSLTGDLLDESWRCIADRGVMLEIGKRDMLDRNVLSMEPFTRNASYRALDMSHPSIDNSIVAGLMSRMFKMISDGHLKPITPMTIFPFAKIPEAIRCLRSGSHIGKIVISDGPARDIQVLTRAAPQLLNLRTDVCYLIIGGLKGLCGSLAIYLVQHGARYLTIMSRSDYQDERSQAVLQDLYALGAHVDLVQGDVATLADVQRAFLQSTKPIAGIIQGAMVLRDKTFPSMTVEDFHETIRSKVQGTWNLHAAAAEMKVGLDFFTMLSSASGIIGQKGQANYAAANVFLDSFAAYRRSLGLAASSIDLGVIEDVGYVSERQDLAGRFEKQSWVGINESLLHKILKFSILGQISPIQTQEASMITGINVPLPENSELLRDARFGALCFGKIRGQVADDEDNSRAIQAFSAMVKSKPDHSILLASVLDLIGKHFTKILGLSEPMEPAKPLSGYGLDSLAAVDLRNWIRLHLGSEITSLEILNAASLAMLGEKIIAKLSVE